eukprot:GFUD01078586.1.p2 GENE.GFUD01078586.1~~GFUD01078586.1.p2  ORF type:complete len:135 (-),score=31.05 GFUD01078586.1:16-420(-)
MSHKFCLLLMICTQVPHLSLAQNNFSDFTHPEALALMAQNEGRPKPGCTYPKHVLHHTENTMHLCNLESAIADLTTEMQNNKKELAAIKGLVLNLKFIANNILSKVEADDSRSPDWNMNFNPDWEDMMGTVQIL